MAGTRKKFIPLIGLLVVLLLAYGLDMLYYVQARAARSNLDFFPRLFVTDIVIGLFLVVIWLALGWLTLVRSPHSVLVSVIFLVLGFLVYLYPYLQNISAFLPLIFMPNVHSPLSFTGIFVAVLGAFHFVLPATISANS